MLFLKIGDKDNMVDTGKNGKYQISFSLLQACTASDLLESWIPQGSPNLIHDWHRSSTYIFLYLVNNEQSSFFNEQGSRSLGGTIFNPESPPQSSWALDEAEK